MTFLSFFDIFKKILRESFMNLSKIFLKFLNPSQSSLESSVKTFFKFMSNYKKFPLVVHHKKSLISSSVNSCEIFIILNIFFRSFAFFLSPISRERISSKAVESHLKQFRDAPLGKMRVVYEKVLTWIFVTRKCDEGQIPLWAIIAQTYSHETGSLKW